jgi:hypothetical protein
MKKKLLTLFLLSFLLGNCLKLHAVSLIVNGCGNIQIFGGTVRVSCSGSNGTCVSVQPNTYTLSNGTIVNGHRVIANDCSGGGVDFNTNSFVNLNEPESPEPAFEFYDVIFN